MEGTEKLQHDLVTVEAMASEMDEYLRNDVLFWPMAQSELPRLTLGGFLMRQHRLLALRNLLSQSEEERLRKALDQYHGALEEKVVRFEEKAHEELEARLRQWQNYIAELKQGIGVAYYESAVEPRAMIEALISQLRTHPYKLQEEAPRKLAVLDRELRQVWEAGEFVWPEAWTIAYPREKYWWLYGRPRKKK